MAQGHGKNQYLSVKDTGGTLRNISVFIDNAEFDRQIDMSESTTVGLEDKIYLPGLNGAAIEVAGKFDDTAVTGPQVVLGGVLAAKVLSGFEFGPLGNAVGKTKYSGNCWVERFRVSAPLEGVVKFAATLRVNGPVTVGVFP